MSKSKSSKGKDSNNGIDIVEVGVGDKALVITGEVVDAYDAEWSAKSERSFMGIKGAEWTPTGMIIDPGMPYPHWEALFQTANGIHKSAGWVLGDILNNGDAAYGEKYTQVMDSAEMEYSTLTKMKWVASVFPYNKRRADIFWSHYAEVAPVMEYSPEVAYELLDIAKANGQNKIELRNEVRKALEELRGTEGLVGGANDIRVLPPAAKSPQAINSNGERVSWLDELLNLVLDVAQAGAQKQLMERAENCVQWANVHRYPIGEMWLDDDGKIKRGVEE